ncbi:IS701 family transposase [Streptomyces sp. IBSBF 2806]|uniref:IS701 family transposase n=1 Tax=Streptomyces sp. IBSBF 2806 TaxID=2903529 RepID=UPI003FA712C0
MAAGQGVDLAGWRDGFDALVGRVAGRFVRVEPRRRARAFVLGLLSDLPRKNCWTLAEQAGDANPYGLQHLLSRAKWDADAVRDDIRGFVVEHLHHEDAVLVVDETGDLKKGRDTVGVQRQYTGTAGRIENSQVAVYLAYSTPLGHAAIDRELYVPRSWTEDTARCRTAGIPDDFSFATKPALAVRMITRALDVGVPASWVAGDEVYGANPHLRTALEKRQVGYVLAVARDHQITTHAGMFRADAMIKELPRRAWQKLSAGAGAKGHRFYDWALADLADDRPGHHQLLVRRNRRTGELAFYRCYSAAPAPLSTLVRVAGRRWTIEETFQSGKGLTGLDEHQVRRWTSWHRWVTLATLAHAFLTVVRADEHARHPKLDGLIPLTCSEIQRLFIELVVRPVHGTAHRLDWSHWRRRHQARSQTSHYQRQAAQT